VVQFWRSEASSPCYGTSDVSRAALAVTRCYPNSVGYIEQDWTIIHTTPAEGFSLSCLFMHGTSHHWSFALTFPSAPYPKHPASERRLQQHYRSVHHPFLLNKHSLEPLLKRLKCWEKTENKREQLANKSHSCNQNKTEKERSNEIQTNVETITIQPKTIKIIDCYFPCISVYPFNQEPHQVETIQSQVLHGKLIHDPVFNTSSPHGAVRWKKLDVLRANQIWMLFELFGVLCVGSWILCIIGGASTNFNDLNLVMWLMWPVISNQIEIENSGVLMSALYSIECFFEHLIVACVGLCWLVSLSVKMVDLSIWSRCFCQHPWNFGVRTRLRDSVQRCTEGSDIGHIGHIGHNDIGPRIARGFGRFQP